MEAMREMCELNVLSDCSRLCSSPMSARMWWKTGTLLPSPAGMCMPDWAIRHSRPVVLSVTVLPPVFGPVMTSRLKPKPRRTSMGTTVAAGERAGVSRLIRSSSIRLTPAARLCPRERDAFEQRMPGLPQPELALGVDVRARTCRNRG